jgi:hypothetical protein
MESSLGADVIFVLMGIGIEAEAPQLQTFSVGGEMSSSFGRRYPGFEVTWVVDSGGDARGVWKRHSRMGKLGAWEGTSNPIDTIGDIGFIVQDC